MNGKIEDLYWKCNKVHGDYSNGGVHVLDVEKFAELIINECINQCFSDDGERIAKHFGITFEDDYEEEE